MPGGIKALVGIGVLILAALILVPNSLYKVDETNQALVLRFGEFNRVKQKPGLNLKVPFIETITKYDKRLLRFDAPPEGLITLDKKNLIIDAYARYKITDPKLFFETVRDEAGADSRLRDIISGELKKQVALFNQSDIIKTQRVKGFIDGVPTIVQAVTDLSRDKARSIGVEIVDVRIKRADFSDTIQQSIFQRMNAERQREASLFRAEGSERDFRIRASADRTRTITLANATRDADIILGCGESVAVTIFASAFNKDPEFFNFQRSLEAYAQALGAGDTLVLAADSELFRYLNDPAGLLGGELPAGFPAVLGEADPAASGPIAAVEEPPIGAIFTPEEITRLIRDCERQTDFIQDIAGLVEDVLVISEFEAGLTTIEIDWVVAGKTVELADLETVITGATELVGIAPSLITADQVVGREVEIIARRQPDESLLALEIIFQP
ncbi:MAG: protease modulator HflC [Dehalococcoidia bacterium]